MSRHASSCIECDDAVPGQIDGEVLLETATRSQMLPGAIECVVPRRALMIAELDRRLVARSALFVVAYLDRLDPVRLHHRAGRDRRGHHHARHRQRRRDERAAHHRLVGLVRRRDGRRRAQGARAGCVGQGARRLRVPLARAQPGRCDASGRSTLVAHAARCCVPMAAVAGAVLGHNYSLLDGAAQAPLRAHRQGARDRRRRAARLRLALLRRRRSSSASPSSRSRAT